MKLKLLLVLFMSVFVGQNLFAAPAITSFSPASGPVGTLVTITGTGLNDPTAFTIGGVTAIVISNTGTKLVGMVMPGATKGPISITAAGSSAVSQSNFIITGTPYPNLTVPEAWIPFTGVAGIHGHFGTSVALSADGKTAVIGAPFDRTYRGSVCVYVKTGNTWVQQGGKLVGSGAVGDGGPGTGARQGSAVAISADGNTIIEGAYNDSGDIGAVWVFIRNGTTWSQQGGKLTGSGSTAYPHFGTTVALSADGNTAVIGGPSDNDITGAIWTFTRNAGVWQQKGAKIVSPSPSKSDQFGLYFSLSADGSTLICSGGGKAWPFIRGGENWILQGGALGNGLPLGAAKLSADGNTALLATGSGSPYDQKTTLYLFTRQNGNWIQQKSTVIPEVVFKAVLTADGNTALIGTIDNGFANSIVMYTRIADNWISLGDKRSVGSSQTDFALCLSANGTEAITGDPKAYDEKGGASFFKSDAGTANNQTITFALQSTAKYGDHNIKLTATSDSGLPVTYNSSDPNVAAIVNGNIQVKAPGVTTITALQPGNLSYSPALTVSRVLTVSKAPLTIKADDKTGISTHPLPELSYTITGLVKNETVANLTDTLVVSTTANFTSPVGTYPITVSGVTSDNYDITYVPGTMTINASTAPAPVITGFSPNSGIVGSLVKINGTDLDFATSLSIAGKPAVIVSNTATQIVAMVMPGAVSGNVSVSTATGTSASTGNFTVVEGQIPNSQQGLKLVGSDSAGQPIMQGSAIASSADGNTIIVGGNGGNILMGAAWIYARAGGSYAQQGPKLTGTGWTGTKPNGFGNSVAISADGNTAIIGGSGDNNGAGSVWLFVRNGDTWVQQGPKLTAAGNVGNAGLGIAVALSADGNTAIVGGNNDNGGIGAAWIFTRHNGIWTQQGDKLKGNDNYNLALQGGSVALSADGNTAVVGGAGDFNNIGAVWVYTRNGAVWTQQGPKLLGTGNTNGSVQGKVAVSADGNTILVGGYGDDNQKGAVWIFIRNGVSWSQQGAKLVAAGITANNLFGTSVALSADGNTAMMGAPYNGQTGAAWVFARKDGVWTQHNQRMVGSGGRASAKQGAAVALSADGQIAFVGGTGTNTNNGAVWVFTPAVKQATIIDFDSLATVNYGLSSASAYALSTNTAVPLTFASSDTTIATIAANGGIIIKTAGTVTITVSQAGDADHAEAEPVSHTLTINKVPLTIIADNKTITAGFSGLNFTCRYLGFIKGDTVSDLTRQPVLITTAVKTSPAGYYPITPDSAVSKNYYFIYKPGTLTVWPVHGPPQITSITPSSGPVGTLVTLTGSNLIAPESVTIGGKNSVTMSANGSQFVGMVMPGAVSGPITFKTDSGITTAPVNFTVTPSPYPRYEMGPKLLPADFGYVSITGMGLSADGNTALVLGSNADKTYTMFSIVRSGDKWNLEDKLLTSLYIREGVSGSGLLSADGNTAAIAVADQGEKPAVLIFVRANGKWTRQSDKLVATGVETDQTGISIFALSADGNTFVARWSLPSGNKRRTQVFTRIGDRWSQMGDEQISAEDQILSGDIALSADGNTLVANLGLDAVVLVRNGDYWYQQDKLPGSNGYNGGDVELTADGNTAYITYNGFEFNDPDKIPSTYSPYIEKFHRESGGWEDAGRVASGSLKYNPSNETCKINANGETLLFKYQLPNYYYTADIINANAHNVNLAAAGTIVDNPGLSLDGNIAFLTEGPYNATGIRFFVSAEKQSQNITFGPIAPRTYGSADTVLIASSANTTLPITFTSSDTTVATIVNNKIHIKAVGTTNITASQANPLVTPATQPFTVKQALLTLTADNKTKAIGTENPPLTATYSGFVNNEDTTAIAIKPVLATTATVNSLVGTYPITASGGSSANYTFKYVPGTLTVTAGTLPVVSSFSPADITPGTVVTITGANLGDATDVSFGGVPAASFTIVSANSITAVVGQGASGDIAVKTSAGTAKASGIKYKVGQTITFAEIAAKTTADGDFDPAATSSSGLPVTYTSSNTAVATIVNGKVHIVGIGSSVIKAAQPGNDDFTPATSVSRTLTVKLPAPVISSFSPAVALKGTTVTITGTNLDQVTAVSFGGTAAASFTVVSSTSIKAVVGAGASGDIKLTAPGGIATLTGFEFVFDLPVNNFKLTITSATCKGSANGSVSIAAVKSLNYTATITGGGLNQAYPFTKNATINNLAAGQYSVCIKVEGQSTFNQCYDVVITEPKDLSVYSTINPGLNTVTLTLGGGDSYRIKLNGEQYTTTAANITLPVKTGDNQLEVTTDKLCQGLISKIINIEAKIIPYPNPFKDVINLNLGTEVIGKANVEISNLSTGGVLVYSNQYTNVSGILQVNPGSLRNGVYVLKLTADNLVRVFKIVKQ